tara:strand:- start:291 stop:419 length:129 start_codon:yes stop_codon:yes gene_type:complete
MAREIYLANSKEDFEGLIKERASDVERGTTEQKNVRDAHGGT